MMRTSAAHTNDQMTIDIRGDMAHTKPYGLLNLIRLSSRDYKSNRGNEEGVETAEYLRWRQVKWHPFCSASHALFVLICACLLLSKNGIIHPNPKWFPGGTRTRVNLFVLAEPSRTPETPSTKILSCRTRRTKQRPSSRLGKLETDDAVPSNISLGLTPAPGLFHCYSSLIQAYDCWIKLVAEMAYYSH